MFCLAASSEHRERGKTRVLSVNAPTCVFAEKYECEYLLQNVRIVELNLHGWEDAFYVGRLKPQKREDFRADMDVLTNVWKNTWEWGGAHHLHELANSGYKVIVKFCGPTKERNARRHDIFGC